MSKKLSQGRLLIELIKRRPYTNMELQMKGISTCHWKRIEETLATKASRDAGERLVKGLRYLGGGEYAVTWSVVVDKKASNDANSTR